MTGKPQARERFEQRGDKREVWISKRFNPTKEVKREETNPGTHREAQTARNTNKELN